MYLILMLGVLGLLTVFEVPVLLKQGYTKDLIAFSLAMVLVAILASLQILKVDVPNPTNLITYIVEKGKDIFQGAI